MDLVMLVVTLCLGLASDSTDAHKSLFNVSVNGIVDYNLNFFNLLFDTKDLTKIELATVVIDEETTIHDVSVEDMSTLSRVGETRLWESENNTLNFIAKVGLDALKISIGNITNSEETFLDKVCIIENNEFSMDISVNFWDWGCFIDLVELKVTRFEVTSAGSSEEANEDFGEKRSESKSDDSSSVSSNESGGRNKVDEELDNVVKNACEQLKEKANAFFAGPNLRKLIFNYSPCSANPGALVDFMSAVRMI